METWIIYALISALLAGFYSFSFKIIAERNYDINLANLYMYATGFVVSLGIFIFLNSWEWNTRELIVTIGLGALMMVFYNISIHSRVESMKNIDATIFYPLYKTFGPLIITAVSLLFFEETFSTKEILGIACGISIPLLLITKTENRVQKNLYRGCVFMLFTSILTALSGTVQKYGINFGLDINLFLTIIFLSGMLFSIYGYYFGKNKQVHGVNTEILLISIVSGLFFVGAAYSFLRALEGNLAIATTINSFSLLIPIILSIIFYGEHFNLKKGIVIALSIVSILLFI